MSRMYENSDLAVSQLRQEQHSVRFARATIWALALALAGFTAWAAVTPVYEVVNGTGQIRPTGLVQRAEHLEGGIVTQVHVEEGDTVRKGELLVSLDRSALLSELEKARAEEEVLSEKSERAKAFLRGDLSAGVEQSPSTIAEENFRIAQIGVLQAERDILEAEIGSLEAREEALRLETGILRSRSDRLSQLQDQGLVMQDQLENANRDLLQQESELAELRGERAVKAATIRQLTARETELTARFQRETALEIENLSAQLIATRENQLQLEDRLKQADVRAPIAGIVQVLAVANPGQVLVPGAVVAEVVPAGTGFFAEVEVSADRISGVSNGRDASLKVLTHDFTRFGDIAAVVERVSPTSVTREDGSAVFKVRLSFDEADSGTERLISAGMTVAADIRTDERTVLEYLLKPVRVIADSALTES